MNVDEKILTQQIKTKSDEVEKLRNNRRFSEIPVNTDDPYWKARNELHVLQNKLKDLKK